jgi:type IV pilus biogenesis protein CpaD/CtpE
MQSERILLVGIFVLAALLLAACSSITPVGKNTYPPTSAERVEILYQEPHRQYEVIALVSHEAGTRFSNVQSVIQKCRELAAQAGADALIVTSSYDQTFNTAAKASAKAIKWK